jgi:hypothetical protein
VNQGGEQGHDDYGLPPVDIEIPDDARELYRDVQAYHRELRALRRQQRSVRWRAPFRQSGIAIPLLAGCLIVALVVVMISAMLAANPYLNRQRPASLPNATGKSSSRLTSPGQASGSQPASTNPALSRPGAGAKPVITRLPSKTISVSGKLVPLRTLRVTVLAIVPVNCGCDAAIKHLLQQAKATAVPVYLVGPPGSSLAMLDQLADLVAGTKMTRVATDNQDVLTADFPKVGLTVLLIDSHGLVKEAHGLKLEKQLLSLRQSG